MRKIAVLVFVAIGMLAIGAVAMAHEDGDGRESARLNGYQENQSVSTAGFGSFRMKVNRDEDSVDYTLTYGGLESAVTMSHIHFSSRSVNGPIAVWLCDGDPNAAPAPPPAPASTPPVCPPAAGGTVHGTFRPNDLLATGRGLGPGTGVGNEREWDELIAAIKVGHTYANVHTATFGGGEIRGQISDRDQKEYTGAPPFLFGDDD